MKQATICATIFALMLSLVPIASGALKNEKVSARAHDFATVKQEEVSAKRQEIAEKIAEKKARVDERLTGARLEKCKKRESKVNAIIAKHVTNDERHMKTFDTVRDNLVGFIERKKLDVSGQAELKDAMDTKRQTALDAIDSLRAQTFSCNDASATEPGSIVKQVNTLARDALKDYRTAIRQYAQAVKKAATESIIPQEEVRQ